MKPVAKGILVVCVLVAAVAILVALSSRNGDAASAEKAPSPAAAERVEVVHFHGTVQCVSCKTVGNLAYRTVRERFAEEMRDGTVIFRSVNGELPENREVAVKFGATGSSLFINAVSGGEDHIEEDVDVWRLVYSESEFMDYLEGRINKLLGE